MIEAGGRVAVVTGAARGIGQAIALRLAKAGRTLALGDLHLRRPDALPPVRRGQPRHLAADPGGERRGRFPAVRRVRARDGPARLRPRKRWGQHFLCDPAVAQRIVDAAALAPDSIVLEIGPGLGALTDQLAARAARLYLVEIDRGLTARLAARYAERPHVRVLQGDVLTLPLDELVAEPSVTVVANLPYNISTPVVFRLLELRRRFPRAILTLQREVAVRLASPPGRATYGVTSVLVQAFAEVQLRFTVSRRSFFPPADPPFLSTATRPPQSSIPPAPPEHRKAPFSRATISRRMR